MDELISLDLSAQEMSPQLAVVIKACLRGRILDSRIKVVIALPCDIIAQQEGLRRWFRSIGQRSSIARMSERQWKVMEDVTRHFPPVSAQFGVQADVAVVTNSRAVYEQAVVRSCAPLIWVPQTRQEFAEGKEARCIDLYYDLTGSVLPSPQLIKRMVAVRGVAVFTEAGPRDFQESAGFESLGDGVFQRRPDETRLGQGSTGP